MNRWIAALCCCVLAACTSDETEDTAAARTVVRSVSIEAGAPATRTELAGNGAGVVWTPGDRIGVFVESGGVFTTRNAPMTFEGTAAAASGAFAGELTLTEGASSYTLYAYYPYDEQAGQDATALGFTLAASQRQAASGDSSHLGDYDLLVAESVQGTAEGFPPLMFRHAFAAVELNLTAGGVLAGRQLAGVTLYCTDAATVVAGGALTDMSNMAGDFTVDLTAADNRTATYRGGSAQIDYCGVTFAEPPTLGTEPVTAYLTINPGDYSRGNGEVYAVLRTADGYTATVTRPGLVISAAQMKVITQNVTAATAPQPAPDLSADAPANCYIVTQPAQEYSFDATVAGNGVIPEGLADAVRTFEGRELSASLAGTTARLLWQSNPHLIDAASVGYAGGRIRFRTTTRPASLGGNAVIGLFASDDPAAEAVWSWHIWITDRTPAELEALSERYTMYSAYEAAYGPGAAVMMDRNLGAVYKEDGPYARSFRAPLYQWGRKDPMPWGKVVFDAGDVPHTYLTYRLPVQTTGSKGRYAGYTGNTYYATAHPDIFIATTPESSYDWYWGGGKGSGPDYRNNQLWGNPTGYTVGQTTEKTLFDPCPAGWKVPQPYVFSAFTTTGNTETVASGNVKKTGRFVQGWNFYYDDSRTTYYPGVGFRYDEFGAFNFVESGYYWTSAPAPPDTFGAWAFGLTAGQVQQRFSDPRGFGLPVRCQRE